MEPRFGRDFSRVRVHTDARAAASAQALNALAYTVGRNVVFGAGQYSPGTSQGDRLVAHELTHVVQQEGADGIQPATLGPASASHEVEADQAAQRIVEGTPAHVRTGGSVPQVQLQRRPGIARSEVQAALEQFLRQAQDAQGGRSLRVTDQVRNALRLLVNLPDPAYTGPGGDPGRAMRGVGLDAWLGGILPGNPAEFARQALRFLPDPLPRGCLAHPRSGAGGRPTRHPGPGP
jgi:hypothetical protein